MTRWNPLFMRVPEGYPEKHYSRKRDGNYAAKCWARSWVCEHPRERSPYAFVRLGKAELECMSCRTPFRHRQYHLKSKTLAREFFWRNNKKTRLHRVFCYSLLFVSYFIARAAVSSFADTPWACRNFAIFLSRAANFLFALASPVQDNFRVDGQYRGIQIDTFQEVIVSSALHLTLPASATSPQ